MRRYTDLPNNIAQEERTEKQIKTRWSDIRKQIKARLLLAYIVQIPIGGFFSFIAERLHTF